MFWLAISQVIEVSVRVSRFDQETIVYEDVNGYQHEVDALAACILDGAKPVVPLADSRGNLAALEALSTSAREGRPVRLEGRRT